MTYPTLPIFRRGRFYIRKIWPGSASLNFEDGTCFSVFTYTDDLHEMDIEINRWPGYDEHVRFSNQPADADEHPENVCYGVGSGSPYLNATYMTYAIDWQPTYMGCSIKTEDGRVIAAWHYTDAAAILKIPAVALFELSSMSYGKTGDKGC